MEAFNRRLLTTKCLICPYQFICIVGCDFMFLQGMLELRKVTGLILFHKGLHFLSQIYSV